MKPKKKKQELAVCPHHSQYAVPIIYTFVFRGAEYWCPYCGYLMGQFDNLHYRRMTPELEARAERYKSATSPYLRAKGTLTCYKLEWPEGSGVYVRPSELPAEYLKQCRQVEWELLRKAESL